MAVYFRPRDLILLTVVSAIFIFTDGAPNRTKVAGVVPAWNKPNHCNRNKTRHGRSVSDTFQRAFTIHRRNYSNTIKRYVKYIEKEENLGPILRQIHKEKEWLRQLNFNHTLAKICPMPKFLAHLYGVVEVYAAAIDRLSQVSLQSQDSMFPESDRADMYTMLKAQLRLFLKECKTELMNRNSSGEVKHRHQDAYKNEIPDVITSKIDIFTQDWMVLKHYQGFLRDCAKSKRIIRNRKKIQERRKKKRQQEKIKQLRAKKRNAKKST